MGLVRHGDAYAADGCAEAYAAAAVALRWLSTCCSAINSCSCARHTHKQHNVSTWEDTGYGSNSTAVQLLYSGCVVDLPQYAFEWSTAPACCMTPTLPYIDAYIALC